MSSPRSAGELIAAALRLYRSFPLLFFTLAAGVIVPYDLIVLAATGSGPFTHSSLGPGADLLLLLLGWVLISPLVSALHVHAVREVGEGQDPALGPIAMQGLRVLPVVVAAAIISGLGIALGLFALIVPGVILFLRWFVVAQTAAIEHEGWLPALQRSRLLTAGHYRHILAFWILVALIDAIPLLLLSAGNHSTTTALFPVELLVQVLTNSFGALATALLYYDLRARQESAPAPPIAPPPRRRAEKSSPTRLFGPSAEDGPHGDRAWDPRSYSDEDRPKGWYVDPDLPTRMRYWDDGDPPGWRGTTRTPRAIRRAWEDDSASG